MRQNFTEFLEWHDNVSGKFSIQYFIIANAFVQDYPLVDPKMKKRLLLFLTLVAEHPKMKSSGYYYFVTSDDTTIPGYASTALLNIKKPFLSYSHLKTEVGGAVFIPDPHFVVY